MFKTQMNEKSQYYTIVGEYKVVQEGKRFCGIYRNFGGQLITSKSSWKQAIKVAKLLNEAFQEGYDLGKDY